MSNERNDELASMRGLAWALVVSGMVAGAGALAIWFRYFA